MKYSTLVSAIMLSSLLAACGGASSSSDKPDSLLPPDLVISSSSSVESSSSSQASVVNAELPIYENFEAVDIDGFFSADYKALASKTDTQFYFSTSGYPVSTNPDGVPRMLLTDWTSKALWFGNARFTLGQTRLEAGTTTALDTASWGELDLSKPFNISFCVKDVGGTLSKHFQIYADNNTTTQGSSLLGNKSRLLNESLSNMTPGQRYSVAVDASLVATEHSFLQFRVESSADLIIDDLVVEYADAPYTGAIPTCTADASFVRPVASSSSSSAASSDASSSVSSSDSSVSSSADSSSSAVSSSDSSSSAAGGSSSSAAAIGWSVYNGDLHPTAANSIALADNSLDTFTYSGASPTDADFFTVASGVATFNSTTVTADKLYAQYSTVLPSSITYPRYYTGLIRAKGNGTNRVIEFDTSISDGTNGSRIKLVLRADGSNQGIQIEKADGTTSENGYGGTYDSYRIYQVAVTLTSATTGSIEVYQDGSDTPIISHAESTLLSGGINNYVRLGDGGSSAYAADIDWVIWTFDGAYKPSDLLGKLPAGLGDTTGY